MKTAGDAWKKGASVGDERQVGLVRTAICCQDSSKAAAGGVHHESVSGHRGAEAVPASRRAEHPAVIGLASFRRRTRRVQKLVTDFSSGRRIELRPISQRACTGATTN